MLTEQTSEPPLDDARAGRRPPHDVARARSTSAKASTSRRASTATSSRCCGTRARDARLYLGASPRAGIALLRVAKARALAAGRDFVLPDDVKAVAEPVLAHRLILAPEARSAGLARADLVARGAREDAGSRLVLTRRGRLALAARRRRLPRRLGVRLAGALSGRGRAPRSRAARRGSGCALARRPSALQPTPAGAREHVEGDDVEVRVELESDAGGSPPARSCSRAGRTLGERVTRLARRGPARCAAATCSRAVPRGRYELRGARPCSRIRSGWRAPSVALDAPRRAARLPAPRRARRASSPSRAALARRAAACCCGGRRGFDLHSVRDYEHGESLRTVHWRSTARRGAADGEGAGGRAARRGRGGARRRAGGGRARELRPAGARRRLDPARARAARTGGRARGQRRAPARRCRRSRPRGLAARARAARRGRARRPRPLAALLVDEEGRSGRALELVVVTARAHADAGRPARPSARQRPRSLVFVDRGELRRTEPTAEPALLRLQAAGVPVAVVRAATTSRRRSAAPACRRRRMR